MFVGSIVVLAAALLPAPVAPLAAAAAPPQPVVSSVSPGSGTIGTIVTITGSGFDAGCTGGQSGQVIFGHLAATDATVSDGAATAVAPWQGAGAMHVRVVDCFGDMSQLSSGDTFVYPSPVVSSVSPGSGTIGTIVTITGSGFDAGCTGGQSGQVIFGHLAATDATVSDGAATAVAPWQGTGAMHVRVVDCFGDMSQLSSGDTFVYPSPVVSSVSPGSGTIGTHRYDHRLGFRCRLYRRAVGPGDLRRSSGKARDR